LGDVVPNNGLLFVDFGEVSLWE